MIDVKHILLVAFFIFAIGMNGCNDRDTTLEINTTDTILPEISSEQKSVKSKVRVAQLKAITPALKNINDNYESSYIVNANNNLTSQIVNKKTDENKTDENKTEGNRTVPTPPVENNESNGTIPNSPDEVIIPVPPKQMFKGNDLVMVLEEIGNQHNNGESNITITDLEILRDNAIVNINDNYVNIYRSYIESNDTTFSSPATVAQVQQMITQVKNLNLPEHAILDRSFFKKTNGKFEHRFVYLAVENNTTGRKWLNNNLGAEYANVDSSDYNPSQQATAIKDLLANGSLFQWGRKADGHELIEWSTLSGKYGTTTIKSDNPDDSLLITGSDDWRVTSDDTLWASESSPNNVCPVGYRLPLSPNGANDGANEWYQETKDLTQNIGGLFHSFLKIPTTGIRNVNGNASIIWSDGGSSNYWSGSVRSDGKALSMGSNWGCLVASDYGAKIAALPVRCIKDQTPAEKTDSILKEIGNEHRNHKSTVTVAQLRAITPALENINDDYQDIYRSYIASADTTFSSPATRDQVQQMVTEVNSFNLPKDAILDRSFFKKTNGAFEHRFVYLPVTNPHTGRTWLNNNLGAEYANKNSYKYNPFRQATTSNDYRAYGSLFQWGREADGHELINWSSATTGTPKYDATFTTTDVVSDALFIIERGANRYDWKITQDDTLWASESSPNSVCPVGYRLPLNPNGANDSENEFYIETQTWRTKDPLGAYRSVLKMPISGYRNHFNGNVKQIGAMASYWSGSPAHTSAHSMDFYPNIVYPNEISPRTYGFNVRCIKEQTPAEKKTFSTLVQIGREHNSAKSTITIAQLKAITPALENINDKYESNYQHYIVSTSTHFSSPATREEVQSMIDAVNLNPAYKLSSYDTDGKAYSITLSSDGTKAYIADYTNGLVIVDISDPAHPTKLGLYNTTSKSLGVVLSSDGTKAYIANYMNGLVIVDISDPTHPTKLGSYETAGLSYGVALSSDGTKAYVADAYEGLVIVDISDPTHPIKLGSYDTAGLAEGVTLSSDGAKAYIADYYNGLVIIDISDPHNPTKLGSYDTAGYLQGVTLSSDGTKAYVADDENGLAIVNISDPYNPTKLGSFDIDRYTWSVTLSNDGTKAYVADGAHGLVIVDISNSTHPTKLSSSDTAGFARHVTLSSDGTKAYVADGSDGLVIVDGIE